MDKPTHSQPWHARQLETNWADQLDSGSTDTIVVDVSEALQGYA